MTSLLPVVVAFWPVACRPEDCERDSQVSCCRLIVGYKQEGRPTETGARPVADNRNRNRRRCRTTHGQDHRHDLGCPAAPVQPYPVQSLAAFVRRSVDIPSLGGNCDTAAHTPRLFRDAASAIAEPLGASALAFDPSSLAPPACGRVQSWENRLARKLTPPIPSIDQGTVVTLTHDTLLDRGFRGERYSVGSSSVAGQASPDSRPPVAAPRRSEPTSLLCCPSPRQLLRHVHFDHGGRTPELRSHPAASRGKIMYYAVLWKWRRNDEPSRQDAVPRPSCKNMNVSQAAMS